MPSTDIGLAFDELVYGHRCQHFFHEDLHADRGHSEGLRDEVHFPWFVSPFQEKSPHVF